MSNDNNIWGIHGGREGTADSLFLKQNVIAVGWVEVGDASKLKPTREAFKAEIMRGYPNSKPAAIPNKAGQLFRFVVEMKVGDLVVYPSKLDRQVHLGRIEGDYQFNPKADGTFPHRRAVKWLRTVSRTHFTQGALYEIGSAMTLFLVKNYADEFRTAIEGKAAKKTPPATDDETIPVVAENIEENTRDFIIKRLAQETKGHPFADFVAHLLNTMGYRTRVSPEGVDGGVDIVAHKDELGFEPPIIKVQVKSTEGSIGDPVVSALYGKVESREHGLIVTLGTFTPPAKTFAKSKSNLRLIDGAELVKLIFDHYDQFDARYKGLLPLRRVYVPEAIDDAEE